MDRTHEAHQPTNPNGAHRGLRRRGLLAAGGAVLAASLLAGACGGGGSDSSAGEGSATSGTLRISNWPLYMADGFNDAFTKATGVKVDYRENFQDNETWFAANKDALAAKQDIGADLVVPTDFMVGRLRQLGWLDKLDKSKVPNIKNIRPDLAQLPSDPGNEYSMPYMSGMTGIAYNKKLVDKPITSIDDLWDPSLKGKVTLLSDLRDGLGMIMLSQGNDPATATEAQVQQAADLVKQQKDAGQIRKFTGNDYQDDLTSGNIAAAQVYSGDVAQLQKANPDLEFVVPEKGSTQFVDEMVIPYTTKDKAGAQAWMNFVYDKDNYAKLIDTTQYIPVLADMTEALNKVNPELASNPLVNPPQATLDKLHSWKTLTDKEEQKFSSIYADVTGG